MTRRSMPRAKGPRKTLRMRMEQIPRSKKSDFQGENETAHTAETQYERIQSRQTQTKRQGPFDDDTSCGERTRKASEIK